MKEGASKIKDYLTSKDVADICCVNRATVVRWIQNKDLFAERTLGGRYRICPKDLLSLSKDKGIFLSPEKRKQLTDEHGSTGKNSSINGKQSNDKSQKPAKANILVVDDDESFRYLISEYLTLHGYKVILADNGYKGLDYVLKDYSINLVILDLLMPGINGIETMKQIKSLRGDLPIIITSGFIDYHFPNGIDGLLSDDDSVLEKPFDLRELFNHCKKVLGC